MRARETEISREAGRVIKRVHRQTVVEAEGERQRGWQRIGHGNTEEARERWRSRFVYWKGEREQQEGH